MELFGLVDRHSTTEKCTSMIQHGSIIYCSKVILVWFSLLESEEALHWAEPMYICFSFPSKKRAALNCLDSKARAAKETHHLADCQSASPVSMCVCVFWEIKIDHIVAETMELKAFKSKLAAPADPQNSVLATVKNETLCIIVPIAKKSEVLHDGPLLVINGVITLINGLLHG